MKIASILPYKENYSNKNAGAVSLWISDLMKYSVHKKNIIVFGNTERKKYLSKNYVNIKLKSINSKFYSSTKEYTKNIIEHLIKNHFDVVELHNRPVMLKDFANNINAKIILYMHNDPRTMKGSRSKNEKLFILDKVDKIVFISNWIKKQFFSNLDFKDHHKAEIIYHSIDPIKKILKKKKQIVFVGKLNEAKGYDLFCKAVNNVLNKYSDWNAFSIGDEKRFQEYFTHKKHKNLGPLENKKVLKIFQESEIAVIPSRWEEPFGRTALESSSCGCATIISNKGGLPETTDYAIILKNLDVFNIEKSIIKLIENKKLRKQLQLSGQKNLKHILKINSNKIDYMRSSLFPFSNFNTNNGKLRIINIYNLAQKLNHRIYNLSIGKKFTNGFIRNGHDVIEISDRDYLRNNKTLSLIPNKNNFQRFLIDTFKNYNPDIVFFGHTKNIDLETLHKIKDLNKNIILSQWNEDPVMSDLNYSKQNIANINLYADLVDHNFITTDPSAIKNIVKKNNFNFFFIPVDKNIERFDVYNMKPKKDLFYAMSHGVNRATLKEGTEDERTIFLNKLVKKIENIRYDFYGFSNKQPIWGNDFNNALINSKMALNLSRGKPIKYYSSNRIASIMGNGLLTFIDEKVKISDFFNQNEIIFYKNISDLSEKIKFYSKKDNLRKKIAKRGKKKYFKLFNEQRIAKYFTDISLGKDVTLF